MGNPVVHFEVVGKDPARMRDYYGSLFGWTYDTSGPVTSAVSDPGEYGFVERLTAANGTGIPGGVCGGPTYDRIVLFYVGVPDVEQALLRAESLGGTRRMGPQSVPGTELVVAHFIDPEGHLIGLASDPDAPAT